MGKRTLDTKHSARKLWLVKVPKFVSTKWKQAQENQQIATMKITKTTQGQEIEIIMDQKPLKLHMTNIAANNLFVMCADSKTAVSIEGRIEHEACMVPKIDEDYRKIAQMRMKACEPKMQTQMIEREELARVKGMGSVMDKSFNKYMRPKGSENKRERIPQHLLVQQLITLFHKEPNWNLRALTEQTQQPQMYLKEVLNSVAVLNKRGPYAGMYSLRPQLQEEL